MSKFFGAITAILSFIAALFAAGHGTAAVQAPNVGDAGAATIATAGTIGFGALAAYLLGLTKYLPAIGGSAGKVIDALQNKDVQEAVAALSAWLANPSDWALRKAAVVQGMEAIFVIGGEFIPDPAWQEKCKELVDWFKANFDAAVPKALDGTPKV